MSRSLLNNSNCYEQIIPVEDITRRISMQRNFTRRFEHHDQITFARLSGDWNPLHVDPVTARRSSYGQIVHGIHTVAWALDAHMSRPGSVPPVRIKVAFLKPINLSEEVHVAQSEEGRETVLLIQHRTGTCASIRLYPTAFGGGVAGHATCSKPPLEPVKVPMEHTFANLRGAEGEMDVWGDTRLLRESFPNLVGGIGLQRTAALLALSRLVGMICPGLYSIFSGFDIAFSGPDGATIPYKVVRHSTPSAPVRVAYAGAGVEGVLDAFVRPAPARQPGMLEIRAWVRPNEFAGQVALIVGGSRGLGETIAKIIAAGGGEPIVTYKVGESDARRVEEEIRSSGGICRTLRLDVLNFGSVLEELAAGEAAPTHLYYFASPVIQANKGPGLNRRLLESYLGYYVDAFESICRALARGKGASVFYPSTVYLEEAAPGFAEYVSAKGAGEALCAYLAREYSNVSILVERLPRMHTDQTNSFLQKKGADPLGVLLASARKFQNMNVSR